MENSHENGGFFYWPSKVTLYPLGAGCVIQGNVITPDGLPPTPDWHVPFCAECPLSKKSDGASMSPCSGLVYVRLSCRAPGQCDEDAKPPFSVEATAGPGVSLSEAPCRRMGEYGQT